MLRKVFGCENDYITVEWRKLRNEEFIISLLTKCYSGDQIKKNEMGGACSSDGKERDGYRVLVGKPEERRPLGRLGHIREDDIKMDLRRIG